ncbi:MAG TPA: ATP synthase F1 subunit gamma [Flavobacteriaceae bacterium]|nr:ATP synthase F1 subunit gamma [Flavobacteriaceae bacterium]
MANLKDIRTRINSVGSTMQITNAMKMVSAAKLKRAQDAITAMRPYSEKLTELLQGLSASMEGESGSVFATEREVEKVLVVLITSNRGLAGAFNTNAIRRAKELAETLYLGKDVDYLTVGKKGHDMVSKTGYVILNNNEIIEELNFEESSRIAEYLMGLFVDGTYDKIDIVYNSFRNAATQVIITETFLPIENQSSDLTEEVELDYIYEPGKAEIIEELIPKSLKTQLYKALRDSVASEHGARMTAMHKATDNAEEIRDDLVLQYNKARQAAITAEILEIVGGAEALAG